MAIRDQTATLLQYTISTTPSPVYISADNDPVAATIEIAVAANPDVLCKYIAIQVPIGNDATDMYQVSPVPTGTNDNPDWILSTDVVPGMSDSDGNYTTFLFKHNIENKAVTSGIKITINGTVNDSSGIAAIVIKEDSTLINNVTYMMRKQLQDITKTAVETLYLNNIIVTYLDTPGVPAALPDRNRGIQLTWDSNGDYFNVYAGSDLKPISQGESKQYVMSGGLITDTVFIIEAIKDNNSVYQQYVLNVNAPDAVISDLSVIKSLDISQVFFDAFNFSTIQYGSYPPNMPYIAGGDGFLIVNIDASSVLIGTNIQLTLSIGDATCTAPNITTKIIPVKKGTSFYLQSGGFGDAKVNYYWIGVGDTHLLPGI
ncbi:hypothetical protein [Chitinophaga sp. sic0106]|uniref:hypothetical protein n=1 Tax=Chitinophaga sp. sic0106 TaxID=2854785 RepID=UPI001C44EF3B|nr:hypothetical protein [Chitinophaga sp. sic0106]MBV7530479.1 hypothetical protein [Chitinophaga sp. sic0106]